MPNVTRHNSEQEQSVIVRKPQNTRFGAAPQPAKVLLGPRAPFAALPIGLEMPEEASPND